MQGFLETLSYSQDCPLSAKEANNTLLKRAVLKRAQPVSQEQGLSLCTPDLLVHVGVLRPVWDLPYEPDTDQRATGMVR